LDSPKLSTGKKIDAHLEVARVYSFYGDVSSTKTTLKSASETIAKGGDWDRRNRLKAYTALSMISVRDLEEANKLLMEGIATFSCEELCEYAEFCVYAVVMAVMYASRVELKKGVIDGSEILGVAKEIPVVVSETLFFVRSWMSPVSLCLITFSSNHIISSYHTHTHTPSLSLQIQLANTLYECNYKAFLSTLVAIQPHLIANRYLQPHSGYILRELHILAYRQFLDSYQSVTLDSMAASFGVSSSFLDGQLSRFIASGRLTAKIDNVGGIVETMKTDWKNARYREMIVKGDALLNRIQKLGRVVDL
jgi:26S proteasome regulatory subunit N7